MGGIPETRYARSGGVDIAYQSVGEGNGIDIVFVPGWISNIEVAWECPELARFLDRLASFGRLVIFDKRGTGLSDRVGGTPTLEERADDVRAVMDTAGIDRAALVGWYDAGAMTTHFAATYPDRVQALVVGCFTEKALTDANEAWGLDEDVLREVAAVIESEGWGTARLVPLLAPSVAHDQRFLKFWQRYERVSASPNAAAALFRWNLELDLRAVLPAVRVPTLVLQRSGVRLVPASAVRHLAAQIPGARYVELPGDDIFPFVGDADSVLDEIGEFLTGARRGPDPDRALATVLFTDIVGSTERAQELGDRGWQDLLDAHRTEVRTMLDRYAGREIDTAGDGFLATFDGPTRAVRCACAIRDSVRGLGLEIRAGVHTGEVERHSDAVTGIAVHVGARVAALAAAGEVLVTTTVKDLALGSGIAFTDRGPHALKGVAGEWRLYAADA